jgi:ATP-dependent RNA helicase DeaD
MTTASAAADSPLASFADLGLPENLLRSLRDVGYEAPSPIQAATIPLLLAGKDVIGHAQTGTGKTAAFALPLVARLLPDQRLPQVLVLAPTRELAIQVAEAFQRYAQHVPGFHVLPIYGGQSYGPQLNALRRGVQVVVGTPGRIIDHLERGSLDLSQLRCLVLDEADEMLRMGFIEDVERVLQSTPAGRQIALFSATMPPQIRRIAEKYLVSPSTVTIGSKTTTASNVRQRYWRVGGVHKLEALTRILEAEPFDAMIVFVRMRQGTEELASRLTARGFAAAAIHGDIAQAQRERTIAQLKNGQLDILIATDVAARGLDVERVSHVLNFDIPHDTESYVHRIGRTGRAGRNGEAILFVTPREAGMLRAIERATRQPIEEMRLPTVEVVNEQRVARFFERIDATLAEGGLEPYAEVLDRFERDRSVTASDIAAALAKMLHRDTPLLLQAEAPARPAPRRDADRSHDLAAHDGPRAEREHGIRHIAEGHRAPPRQRTGDGTARASEGADPRVTIRKSRPAADESPPPRASTPAGYQPEPSRDARVQVEPGMELYRVDVGTRHGARVANIVGAIANEVGLQSRYIGRVDMREDYSLVALPDGMPRRVLAHLQQTWVCGQYMRLRRASPEDVQGTAATLAVEPPEPPPETVAEQRPKAKPKAAAPAPSKPLRTRKTRELFAPPRERAPQSAAPRAEAAPSGMGFGWERGASGVGPEARAKPRFEAREFSAPTPEAAAPALDPASDRKPRRKNASTTASPAAPEKTTKKKSEKREK